MKTLIAYATNSGSTYTVGQMIQHVLIANGLECDIKRVNNLNPKELENYEVIIFGSPSWKVDSKEGQPQEYMQEFLKKLTQSDLAEKKTAVYGCGDRSYAEFCGAVDEIETYIKNLDNLTFVPSLRIDSFYFDMDKNEKIVKEWANDLALVKTGSVTTLA